MSHPAGRLEWNTQSLSDATSWAGSHSEHSCPPASAGSVPPSRPLRQTFRLGPAPDNGSVALGRPTL
jgi:hypothetical protein